MADTDGSLSSDSSGEDETHLLTALPRLLQGRNARVGRHRIRNNVTPFELKQRKQMPYTEFAMNIRKQSGESIVRRSRNRIKNCFQQQIGMRQTPSDRVRACSNLVPNRIVTRFTSGRSRFYGCEFTRSGEKLLLTSQNQSIAVFDTNTLNRLNTIDCRDVQWTVSSTSVSPDEKFVIYSSMHTALHLCNLEGEHEVHEVLDTDPTNSFPAAIFNAKFSQGGSEVVAACSDGRLVIYDVERKKPVERIMAHSEDINSVTFGDDSFRSNIIVSGSDDHKIKVWDRRLLSDSNTRGLAGVFRGHLFGLTHVTCKGDGKYILSNSKDQTAKLWDLRNLKPDSGSSPTHGLRMWDYRWMDYPYWGQPVHHPDDSSVLTYRGHRVTSTLIRAYFSPTTTTGQKYIYSGSADGSVYIYDAVTAKLKTRLSGHNAVVRDVSWHPTLPLLACASWDSTASLWSWNHEAHAQAKATHDAARDEYLKRRAQRSSPGDGSDAGEAESGEEEKTDPAAEPLVSALDPSGDVRDAEDRRRSFQGVEFSSRTENGDVASVGSGTMDLLSDYDTASDREVSDEEDDTPTAIRVQILRQLLMQGMYQADEEDSSEDETYVAVQQGDGDGDDDDDDDDESDS